MGHAAQELVALRSTLQELGIPVDGPSDLFCDNTGAISFAKDGGQYSKMKHINLREHFLRELTQNGEIAPAHINTAINPADIFTKALGPVKFMQHRRSLHVVSLGSIPTLEGGN